MDAPDEEEWEFEKCKPGAGPHGHTAVIQRTWAGSRGSGKMIFEWKCVDCGQKSKVAVVRFVDRRGCVL
jgi:hypothetical protein